MLKKILICAALVAGFAAVGTASVLMNVGAYEQGVEITSTIDTLELTAKTGNLPAQPAADAI